MIFLLVLGIVSRKFKTRKLLLLPCIYTYNISFTMQLTTTLLRKLATFFWKSGMKIKKILYQKMGQWSLSCPFWHSTFWNFAHPPLKSYVYWNLGTSRKDCSHTIDRILKIILLNRISDHERKAHNQIKLSISSGLANS